MKILQISTGQFSHLLSHVTSSAIYSSSEIYFFYENGTSIELINKFFISFSRQNDDEQKFISVRFIVEIEC